jgi:hypothetical protein
MRIAAVTVAMAMRVRLAGWSGAAECLAKMGLWEGMISRACEAKVVLAQLLDWVDTGEEVVFS